MEPYLGEAGRLHQSLVLAVVLGVCRIELVVDVGAQLAAIEPRQDPCHIAVHGQGHCLAALNVGPDHRQQKPGHAMEQRRRQPFGNETQRPRDGQIKLVSFVAIDPDQHPTTWLQRLEGSLHRGKWIRDVVDYADRKDIIELLSRGNLFTFLAQVREAVREFPGVLHQDFKGPRRLYRENVRRASGFEQHDRNSSSTAADLTDVFALDVGSGKKRVQDFVEKLALSVISGVDVVEGLPLYAEVFDRLSLDTVDVLGFPRSRQSHPRLRHDDASRCARCGQIVSRRNPDCGAPQSTPDPLENQA